MRPARLKAATAGITALLLVAGVGTAVPADAKAKTKATRTSVTAGRAVAGAKVTLTATITPKVKVGTVRFTAGGKTVSSCGKVTVRSGKARCTTRFATAGKRAVAAKYSGKAKKYKASTGRRTVAVTAAPKAVSAGSIVGTTSSCTTSTGALVAVSFAKWSGPVVRGCDTTPTKGNELLTTAGFTLTGTQHDGPAFVCRLAHPLFDGGKPRPTTAEDACVRTPPTNAYWSYWTAAKGTNTWSYAKLGAYSQTVTNGDINAWTFGATDTQGTTGKPSFTPDQIRAGIATKTATPQRRVAAAPAKVADLAAATKYLTSTLVDGTHYEPFGPGFADVGLTVDTALALAATGSDDATLKKITEYVDQSGGDYTGVGTEYAGGGSIGKVALLAIVTGQDPRDFAGHDLIAALKDVTCTTAVTDVCEANGNYRYASSTFSQSLGVISQLRAGDTANAAQPLAFLRNLQHGDAGPDAGAFPSLIPGSDAEVDSTAMAAMALHLAGDTSAVDKALAWIAGEQNADGSFPGAAGSSTNSAALAILGLTLAGTRYRDQIDAAERFLATEQNPDGGFTVAAGDTNGSDVRASAQVVSGLVGTPFSTLTDDLTGAAAQPDAAKGAAYLVRQLVDGDHLEFAGGFGPDFGGTADVAVALAAAGGYDPTLVKIMKYLRAHATDYVDPAGKADFPGPFTGGAGKLATLTEITGQDPTSFGGVNLLQVLTDNVCTVNGGPDDACTAPGDFYQAFATTGQAFGVLALARAGVAVPTAALNRLLALQCDGGGFSSSLIDPDATCVPEVDTTGFALQALALVKTSAARQAVERGVKYLRAAQSDDNGSWTGAAGENTNSTALAIQGLLAAPASADFPTQQRRAFAAASDPAVKAGRPFLASLQNADGGFAISAAAPDSDVFATRQVVPAVANATLSYLSHPVSLGTAPGDGGETGSGTPSSPSSGGPSSGTDGPAGGNASAGAGPDDAASGGTADTGVPAGQLLGLALALLLVGVLVTVAGRRRSLFAGITGGRHRP